MSYGRHAGRFEVSLRRLWRHGATATSSLFSCQSTHHKWSGGVLLPSGGRGPLPSPLPPNVNRHERVSFGGAVGLPIFYLFFFVLQLLDDDGTSTSNGSTTTTSPDRIPEFPGILQLWSSFSISNGSSSRRRSKASFRESKKGCQKGGALISKKKMDEIS